MLGEHDMSRVVRFSQITLLLAVLAGCSPDLLGNFFPRSAVAPQLLAVVADPASFPPESHPLRDVANGTIIDDLAGLTGFWGGNRDPLWRAYYLRGFQSS